MSRLRIDHGDNPIKEYPDDDDQKLEYIFYFLNKWKDSYTPVHQLCEYLGWDETDVRTIYISRLLTNCVDTEKISIFNGAEFAFKPTTDAILGIDKHGSYLKWKQSDKIKNMSFDEMCNLVLLELETQSGFVKDVLEKHGIDTALTQGIESDLKSKKFICLTNNGSFIEGAGRTHLARIKIDGKGAPTGLVANINVDKSIKDSFNSNLNSNIIQDSDLSNSSEINLKSETTNKNNPINPQKRSIIEILYWIAGIVAGSVILYEVLKKYPVI